MVSSLEGKKLAEAILLGIRKKGINQKDLAKRIGVQEATISNWINNQGRTGRFEKMIQLMGELDIITEIFPDYVKRDSFLEEGKKREPHSPSISEEVLYSLKDEIINEFYRVKDKLGQFNDTGRQIDRKLESLESLYQNFNKTDEHLVGLISTFGLMDTLTQKTAHLCQSIREHLGADYVDFCLWKSKNATTYQFQRVNKSWNKHSLAFHIDLDDETFECAFRSRIVAQHQNKIAISNSVPIRVLIPGYPRGDQEFKRSFGVYINDDITPDISFENSPYQAGILTILFLSERKLSLHEFTYLEKIIPYLFTSTLREAALRKKPEHLVQTLTSKDLPSCLNDCILQESPRLGYRCLSVSLRDKDDVIHCVAMNGYKESMYKMKYGVGKAVGEEIGYGKTGYVVDKCVTLQQIRGERYKIYQQIESQNVKNIKCIEEYISREKIEEECGPINLCRAHFIEERGSVQFLGVPIVYQGKGIGIIKTNRFEGEDPIDINVIEVFYDLANTLSIIISTWLKIHRGTNEAQNWKHLIEG